ncbi:MAG: thioesterase family protein [Oscillospiraceae bacterium]|nr:thioesterase family protein [Oscillospiraceae bacterium]
MQIGETNEISRVVTEDLTAAAVGSGGLRVFGTPYLVAMMENAALETMARSLPEDRGSVGTKVEVSHTAPTPLGGTVTVKTEITGISANGKLVDFKMTAWDGAGPIGEGVHQRAVIHCRRFLDKAAARGAGAKE